MYGNLKSFYIPFVHITHAELSKTVLSVVYCKIKCTVN